jgi:hypothetical protein
MFGNGDLGGEQRGRDQWVISEDWAES